ncbi:peptidoglycan-binding protein [Streptomyces sp. SAS_281]|uniref:peptidoglycan-binding domain-containing protein n=1 Tax=Streptomyces sp. SAS_281 TaxID=3412744 RepID=UPI00403D1850
MRKRLLTGLVTAGLVLSGGLLAAPAANAAIITYKCEYTAAEPELAYGDSGTAVTQLQCELNNALSPNSFVPLEKDGVWGPATERAVRNFQACVGIEQDGIAGPHTWSQLDAAASNPMGWRCH